MLALVPVKRFASGKSRLAGALSAAQRAELACLMLEDVLHALRLARCVDRVVVVSNEAGIDELLKAAGVERCRDAHEGDPNRSLMAAAAALPVSVGRVLILPADVPAVRAADIDVLEQEYQALSRPHKEVLILCPETADGGTNALLSSLPLPIALEFGEASLARHLGSAQRRGVSAQVISLTGLARDMDRPADLEWLVHSASAGRARAYVRRLWRPATCEAT